MHFNETVYQHEYDLIAAGPSPKYQGLDAVIVTSQGEVPVMRVISVDWVRDYRYASTDEILMEGVMEWGQYLSKVLPYKENLKVTLTRRGLNTFAEVTDDSVIEETFNAFILLEPERASLSDSPETSNTEAADLMGLKHFMIQLQDPAAAVLRSEVLGGIFRDSTPFSILFASLRNNSETLDLEDDYAIKGYHVVNPNNTTPRANTIIQHGTTLMSLADKLQTQHGGIYSAGIGCYLQKGYWYVWPLYDFTRFDEAKRTALFIIPPTNRLGGLDKTYRVQDDHLVAIITGGVGKVDLSETRLLNEGSGTRFADAGKMMEGFFDTQGNKATAIRTYNASEYDGVKRPGQKMIRVQDDLTNTNSFQEASKIAERNGLFITLNWENADPEFITPGLQCEISYIHNGDPVYVNAVVVFCHVFTGLSGTGLHQTAYQTTCQIGLMVDRLSPLYELAAISNQ